MRWISEARERVRILLFRQREEAEMDEELAFHLEMETEKNLRAGMSPQEARRCALLAFGGVTKHREAVREARGLGWAEDLWRDLRLAARSLRKSPAFALTVVLTLALGIGATTAVFGLANWLLLRPVPGIVDPERLVIVEARNGRNGTGFSFPNLVDLREGTEALSALAGTAPAGLQLAVEGEEPLSLTGEALGGDYFGLLGLRPLAGRLLRPEELGTGARVPVVVISSRLWSTLFGRDPGAIGRRVGINGIAFTVVGVAPEGFRGIERLGQTDAWIPGSLYAAIRHFPPEDGMEQRESRAFMQMVGRLRPGATLEVAQAQLRAVMASLVDEYPEANEIHREYLPTVFAGVGLRLRSREAAQRTVRLMMGMVALVLLTAVANAANLLLLRALRRRGETAVRRALGASGGRVLQQNLTEAVLLAAAGGAGALLLALGIQRLFRGTSVLALPPIEDLPLDGRVLGFAVAVSLAAAVACAAAPTLLASRVEITDAIKGTAARTGAARGRMLRASITVVQLSLAMVLLIGALLLARTLWQLHRVDLGFRPEGVLSFTFDPEPQGYSADGVAALRRAVREGASGLPGIASAALVAEVPFGGSLSGGGIWPPRAEEGAPPIDVKLLWVSPGYLETLGVPVRQGRGFQADEVGAGAEGGVAPALVSETLARRLFGGRDPTGRILDLRPDGSERARIVGVVGDTRTWNLREAPDPLVYLPIGASWFGGTTLLVRSALPAADAEAAVRGMMAEIDPSLALFRVATLPELVTRTIAEERLLARLFGFLALLASALAGVGLYAVVGYGVAARTRELGIRLALGAETSRIVRLVAGQAMGLAALGLSIGALGGIALSRVLRSRVFGVDPLEPAVYLIAGGAFALLALLASLAPARAAGRVDPMVSLRHE